MTEQSLTETLAAWLVGWRDRGLPAEVLDTARTYVVDWLGSALAGTVTRPGRMLLEHAAAAPPGPCSVAGLDEGRSAEQAALTHGGLSHIVEMDDLHRASVLHPGAVVIPAALAVAEAEGAGGAAFLSAVVVGYEVACRVGEAIGKQHYRYFHNTSTCGVFGAATAAGWLLGLDEDELVSALGSAGTQASGLWEFNADGTMSKHLHTGRAAASGVLAAALAGRGFTGARRILEGERGLFAAMAPDATPHKVVEGLDEAGSYGSGAGLEPGAGAAPSTGTFRIGDVSLKPHASCRHTHAPVDAALAVRRRLGGESETGWGHGGGRGAGGEGADGQADGGQAAADDGGGQDTAEENTGGEGESGLDRENGAGLPADAIGRAEVETYAAALDLCDRPEPRTPYDARFSLQYCVASALLRGRVGLHEFTEESLEDPGVRRLLSRVECRVDPRIEAAYPARWSARVRVRVSGADELLEATVDAPRGDPENPLEPSEVEGKFRELAAWAGRRAEADEWLDWVRKLGPGPLGTGGLPWAGR